ncbi:MAG TPA: protein translocase subunit SecD [Spirochaetota bacterium]
MTQRNLLTLLIIAAVTVLSIMLILPTVGKNEMVVVLNEDATASQVELIRKRFPDSRYKVTVDDKTISISGYGLNNAVMNEVLKKEDYPFVNSAKISPHWAEEALLAKRINLGLDLQGGSMLVLQADYERMEKKMGRTLSEKDKTDITNQALDLIRNRIDAFGVSEPSVRTRGADQIELQLPGVRDPKAIKDLLGMTGRVEYRLADDALSVKAKDAMAELKILPPVDQAQADSARIKISDAIKCPADKEVLFYYDRDTTTNKIRPAYPIVLEKHVALAGSDIATAAPGTDDYGRLAVHFTTTAEGAQKFSEATAPKNKGRRLAIVIDDKVRSAPAINGQINAGKAIIEGSFSEDEVNILVRIIKEGALPVDLRIVEERSVGPSLGQDSINAGIKAGVVALIAISFFMIIYYRMSGFIAIVGLVLNGIYALAMLSWLGFTLTLPGIAGFVLTLGVAVDANVIIYERIREEIRNGRNVRTAITMGFEHAFWTIFDSNLTTVLAALILSMVGTGPIKGYAVTLTIGIIANMFVALYVTKFVYELIGSRREIKKLSI